MLGLAGVAGATGNHKEAERLARQAPGIREEQLGPEHLSVAHDLWRLALISVQQGQASQAEVWFKRALFLRERRLEEMHDFAGFQHEQDRAREAAVLYQRTLATRERILGPTLETRTRLLAVLGQRLERAPTGGECGSRVFP